MKINIEKLFAWYDANQRKLPGRGITDPYRIWISEIMAQQTRMETVKGYYERFLKELPNIESLANVSDEKLMKLWEGLGYYSRARNLKESAIAIVKDYGGIFPNSYNAILKLKGIGEYTAGAILSRAYGLPYASVDGNILRVLTRYEVNPIDIATSNAKIHYKKELEKMKVDSFGKLNEALMELGATICMPKVAKCELCPLNEECQSYHNSCVFQYPVKTKKVKIIENEYTCLFLCNKANKIYLEKKEDGLLKGLYAPIVIEGSLEEVNVYDFLSEIRIKRIFELTPQKHVFTHRIWHMRGYFIQISESEMCFQKFYSLEEVEKNISVSTCFRKFFNELEKKMK
ncbi:MAG: A/G-specific adenine glycosylase [Prevotella sp.]|nr:A/G-specific adenine glycosylase [Staphylococcus sp.]MCM1350503.1 A/G-specific adenine glycosylase [Prevotella sp.]